MASGYNYINIPIIWKMLKIFGIEKIYHSYKLLSGKIWFRQDLTKKVCFLITSTIFNISQLNLIISYIWLFILF